MDKREKRPLVIIVHGHWCNGRYMSSLVNELVSQNMIVLTYDDKEFVDEEIMRGMY